MMEDKSEAKYLKKLQDERDVIILKKLELCEALDDGQKKSYPRGSEIIQKP